LSAPGRKLLISFSPFLQEIEPIILEIQPWIEITRWHIS